MGLFDDVLSGVGGINSEPQLSYEEESYIEQSITYEPETLSNYTTECYLAYNDILHALDVSEGYAAKEILQGKPRNIVMESLASRAGDAYDTLKRWAAKIWKAIKKFVTKAWNRLKAIGDRIKAFFTSYENVLRETKGTFTVQWVDMDISTAARQINADYAQHVSEMGKNMSTGYGGGLNPVDTVVKGWRELLYKNTKGEPEFGTKKWDDVKPAVLRITTMGYDKFAADFLRWGEKDYRDAVDLDKDRVNDYQDAYDDIEKDDKNVASYHAKRDVGRAELLQVRARLQLRQRGIQLLASACNRMYNQCLAAARIAIKHKHGVGEGYTYNNTDTNSIASMMI